MTISQALIAYCIAAGLLTLTPGLDTALVLRTAAVEGPKKAWLAGFGICLGTLAWGAMVALGLGALLAASAAAFTVLKWAGAAYLVWLGVNLIIKPRDKFEVAGSLASPRSGASWLWRGMFNYLLNP